MAVTFTDKAAGELRARLRALGTDGVRASTFHSAALALLRHFAGDPGRILPSKAPLLRRIGNSLPGAFRFRPAGDLATEIEWAKNRRLTPDTYHDWLGDHEPPIPPDLSLPGVPGVRAAQGRRGAARLRGPARAGGAAARRGRGRAGGGARPLARLHRRRVPGRQPAPAVAARPLARRPGRSLRGRRRLPGDLRLHGRERRVAARAAAALPPRSRRAARAELPLDRRR